MRARVPASSANLGPGYDVLAVALDLYCSVTVEPATRLQITVDGEGADFTRDASHLAAAVARRVLGHDDVAIHVSSQIPVSRGLGSSAALALATAAAAGAPDPLAVAVGIEGHAENAGASFLGGLVAATLVDGRPVARRLPLDPGLVYVVVVPERTLLTKEARAVLPREVPLEDAVQNLGRMGLLVAGLADRSVLVPEAGEDRLHQEARASVFEQAPELLARLREGGAVLSTWSGAGPSMLGVCVSEQAAAATREAADAALLELGLAGRTLVLHADTSGLVIED